MIKAKYCWRYYLRLECYYVEIFPNIFLILSMGQTISSRDFQNAVKLKYVDDKSTKSEFQCSDCAEGQSPREKKKTKNQLLAKTRKCEREDKSQFPHVQTPFTRDMVWNWDGRFRADLGVNYNLTRGYRQILTSLSTLIRFLPKIVHNLLDTCFVPLFSQKNVSGMQIPAFTSLSRSRKKLNAKAAVILRNDFSRFFKNRLILSLQVSQPQVNTGLTICFLLPHRQV